MRSLRGRYHSGLTLPEALLTVLFFGILGGLLAMSLSSTLKATEKVESRTVEGQSVSLFYANLSRRILTASWSSMALSPDGTLLSFARFDNDYTQGSHDTLLPLWSEFNVVSYDPGSRQAWFSDYSLRRSSYLTHPKSLLYSTDILEPEGENVWLPSALPRSASDLEEYHQREEVLLEEVESMRFFLNEDSKTVLLVLDMFEVHDETKIQTYRFRFPILND